MSHFVLLLSSLSSPALTPNVLLLLRCLAYKHRDVSLTPQNTHLNKPEHNVSYLKLYHWGLE